ncbi:Uncharacterised protein [Mesomycoplasma neurolyticum]|uniref:Uncharacterized protein n=1 Tax=Mesomycoplasma neurolyticum TaxID=2120 RepID=A0A449A5D5_9BACT|nr:Uncharacterised protein [Mesomycoplasma neurolyticum]
MKNAKKDSEFISSKINECFSKFINHDLSIKNKENKEIIELIIFEGEEKPYYFSNKAYIRNGNTTINVTGSQLDNLILQGKKVRFDEMDSGKNKNDTTFKKFEKIYLEKTNKRIDIKDFYSFNLINKNEQLTNAGLLFSDDGLPEKYSRVYCRRWNGLDKAPNNDIKTLDYVIYKGSILYLLEKSIEFIKKHSNLMWKKDLYGRNEYYDYPKEAIREVIVNALVHRDYTRDDSEISIDIYDDRLEITSPGGMYSNEKIQDLNIMNIPSERRNRITADLMFRMKFMEISASGIQEIIKSYERSEKYSKNYKPIFESTDRYFKVKLWNLNYEIHKDIKSKNSFNEIEKTFINSSNPGDKSLTPAINSSNPGDKSLTPVINSSNPGDKSLTPAINSLNYQQKLESNKLATFNNIDNLKVKKITYLKENIEKILSFSKNNEYFKSSEIEKELNLKRSRVREILSKMVKENLIEPMGKNKSRKYKIKKPQK